jgi:hypothetical protein
MNKQKYLNIPFLGGMIIILATYIIGSQLNNHNQFMRTTFELNIELLEAKEVEDSTILIFKESFDKMIISHNTARSLTIYPLLGIGFIFLMYSAFVRTKLDRNG